MKQTRDRLVGKLIFMETFQYQYSPTIMKLTFLFWLNYRIKEINMR